MDAGENKAGVDDTAIIGIHTGQKFGVFLLPRFRHPEVLVIMAAHQMKHEQLRLPVTGGGDLITNGNQQFAVKMVFPIIGVGSLAVGVGKQQCHHA